MRIGMLCLALAVLGGPATAGAVLSLQDSSAPPGAIAEVALTVNQEVKGITAGVVRIEVGKPSPINAPSLPPLLSAVPGQVLPDMQIAVNPDLNSGARIAFASAEPGDGPGTLLTMRIQIPPKAPVGARYPLYITAVLLEKPDGTRHEVATSGAVLSVKSPVPEKAALTVSSAEAKPGGTAEIAIRANDSVPHISSADLTVSLIQSTPAGRPLPKVNEASIRSGTMLPDAQIAAHFTENHVLRIALASPSSGSGPGTLCTFLVTVPPDARPGDTYAIDLQAVVGIGETEWPMQAVGGTLTVIGEAPTERKKGDVNGDGAVTIADAVLALQMAVQLVSPTPDQLFAADINGNGAVSVGDVVAILRAVLGIGSLV